MSYDVAGQSNNRSVFGDDRTRLSDNVTWQGDDSTRKRDSSTGNSDSSPISSSSVSSCSISGINLDVDDQKNIGSDILTSSESTTSSRRSLSTAAMCILARARNVTLLISLPRGILIVEIIAAVAVSNNSQSTC